MTKTPTKIKTRVVKKKKKKVLEKFKGVGYRGRGLTKESLGVDS